MNKSLPIYDLNQFVSVGDENGFYVSEIASHLKRFQFVSLPHKHNFYLVLFCTKGKGTHIIDFESYEIKPGGLYFLAPGESHHWTFTEEIEGYVFFHSKEFYDMNYLTKRINDFPFYYCSYNSSAAFLSASETVQLENSFIQLMKEYKGDAIGKYLKICSLIDLIYIDASRIYLGGKPKVKPGSRFSNKIRILEKLIDENMKKIKSPSKYASMMNVSPKQLNRICQDTLGKTTSILINEKLMLEAKRMLAYGERNVSEVATELGFVDTTYFARIFKKHTGQTPNAFMKKYLKAVF